MGCDGRAIVPVLCSPVHCQYEYSRTGTAYPIGEQEGAETEFAVLVDDLLRVLKELWRVAARICSESYER